MFWKKREKSNYAISRLEKRVCDIENPYKYKMGDNVSVEYYIGDKVIIENGVIVDIKHNYVNPYQALSSNLMFISDYHLELMYSCNFNRENLYYIYIPNEKNTHWFNEKSIIESI